MHRNHQLGKNPTLIDVDIQANNMACVYLP